MGTAAVVRNNWARLKDKPGGRKLFSWLIGRLAPYSGTMGATVLELGPGHARLELRERRRIRNHLHSVHAIALANVAELTSGLAVMYGLPDEARGILTALSIEYLKKGRGRLVASTDFAPPDANVRGEHDIVSEVRDEAGDVVARARARWLLEPLPAATSSPEATGAAAGAERTP